MKQILFIITVAIVGLTSCTKENFEPNYVEVPEEVIDTTAWNSGYGNGGTLPPNGGTMVNDLVGTTWVLTKIVSAFATEYPNDTIYFVDNTHYTLNNGAVRNYQLSSLPSSSNFDLSLYYFAPFGGSHYSGQVGQHFIDDAEINNVEFTDIQNPSTVTRAWLEKI